MNSHTARNHIAILLIVGLFVALRISLHVSQTEIASAAAKFGFSKTTLPELADSPVRMQRLVHPSLRRISAFVSTVGAAVALNDVDGDGVSNDACYIDTRTDDVVITPVPGTGDRYKPFALNQGPLFNRDRMAPLGVLLSDVNEDGHVDVVVYYAGRSPLIFLWRPSVENSGQSLSEANYTARDIFPPEIWMTGSATTADLDGDGHLDLIFANYFKDGSDIYNPSAKGTVSMPESFSHAFNGGGERIYRWTGSTAGTEPQVTYEEVLDALPAGVGGGWGLAIGACDLDGDLLPELYVAHDFGPDRLFWNRSTPGHIHFALLQGQTTFSTPKSYVLGKDSFKSMGVDFGDLNDDGIPDIYVSNITEPGGLQESQMMFVSTGPLNHLETGIAPYVNKSESLRLSRTGWAWDAKLDDFDNDGRLEALQATGFIRGKNNNWPEIQELGTANDVLISSVGSWPKIQDGADLAGHDQNPFFVQVGDHFVDIAKQIGFGEDYVSRGIAIADVDLDGRLDMVVSNMWGPASYYHNESPRSGAFLGLRLLLPIGDGDADTTIVQEGSPTGDIKGRAAVGATVTVTLPSGRVLTRQVDGGNGHSGKRSPELHFGLGEVAGPVQIKLAWRDRFGHVQHKVLRLNAGWYTVLLGSDSEVQP
ncbi:MAG TPA: CRTAC1 family protein [Pyrinomonadaceae bacterium]